MKRYAFERLIEWKKSPERKPLVIYGARQVGKTWLVEEFAEKEFDDHVPVDFLKNPEYREIFKQNLDPVRIIKALEVTFNKKIIPGKTLIFFDEVQECKEAKNSLKYFADTASEYHVVAAGSFLGLSTGGQFPVGKTDSLTLYPMSFYEFLEGIGRVQLLDAIKSRDTELLSGLSSLLIDTLKTYFYVGGMPEVVALFAKYDDLGKARQKQLELLSNYDLDFSNHIPDNLISKVKMIWNSIPTHLAREKKKFVYKEIKTGGRASEFEDALNRLEETGLIYKVLKTFTPKIPLSSYQEKDIFKLYMLDVGLLCAKSKIDISTFYLSDNGIFSDFQGALAEQYVLQELEQSCSNPIFYWGRDKGDAEVDFIMQYKSEIIPIEVKSAWRTQSKSLTWYRETEKPKHAVRLSLNNYDKNDDLYSIPLYMISSLSDIIEND